MNNFNGSTKIDNEGNKDFYKLAQLIGDNIQKIIQNVSSMNRIVMKLNKIQDAAYIKQNLRKISNYTQQLTKDTNHNLKELYEIRHSSQTEQMQFKILKERLAERFKSALSEFEAVQCKVYDKENELMKLMKSSESTTILPPPSGSNHLNDYSTFKGNKNDKKRQTQLQIQYSVDPKIIQREQDVLQIEKDVKDVHEMFQEFASYIDNEREMINRVEDNVSDTEALINLGNTYLGEASRYTNKFRKKSCYLSVICIVVILVIIYLVFFK